MRNFRLTLSYDGTDFSGWQLQPGRRTVQGVLESAIGALTGAPARVNASGRTDAGVHAVGQVVNFYTNTALPAAALVSGLNAHLPEDAVVRGAMDMPQAFDANRDSRRPDAVAGGGCGHLLRKETELNHVRALTRTRVKINGRVTVNQYHRHETIRPLGSCLL